jgi:hypothetical protein
MNLVKAYIVGGACEGATMWVDKDSSLTHWNQGTCITTYKTYGAPYQPLRDKNEISQSWFHARIKREFIELIEEEPKPDTVSDKKSTFETIVAQHGDKSIFSVITVEDGDMMKGDITFKECEEWINGNQDAYDSDFEIVMKIMETKTVKQMKPTI